MRKHYTLVLKPHFNQGQEVEVDFGCMVVGMPVVKGRVIGKASDGIIDYWIVDFEICLTEILNCLQISYPYSAMSIQHTFMLMPEGEPLRAVLDRLKDK